MKTNEKGQIILILLMVMLLVLVIAVAIAQRSLTYLSTANKSEQSSRAFSAAQSGIDQGVNGGINSGSAAYINQAVSSAAPIVTLPLSGSNDAIEYPPVGKDTAAQVWIIDPSVATNFTSASGPAQYASFPAGSNFTVYYGSIDPDDPNNYTKLASANKPALEIDLITFNTATSSYKSYKSYYDESGARQLASHFTASSCNAAGIAPAINTTDSTTAKLFACATPAIATPLAEIPVMIRVRVLYSDISQSIAIRPQQTGGVSFPPQIKIFRSTGTSGQVKQNIKVFQAQYVVPSFFDYAIFSGTDIKKCSSC